MKLKSSKLKVLPLEPGNIPREPRLPHKFTFIVTDEHCFEEHRLWVNTFPDTAPVHPILEFHFRRRKTGSVSSEEAFCSDFLQASNINITHDSSSNKQFLHLPEIGEISSAWGSASMSGKWSFTYKPSQYLICLYCELPGRECKRHGRFEKVSLGYDTRKI